MKIRKYIYLAAVALLAVMGTGLLTEGANAEAPSKVLELSVTADNTTARVGDNLTFTYVLYNAGTAAVENITLRDSRLGAIALGQSNLAAGENITVSAVYTVKTADLPGPLRNFVAVAGRLPSGAIVRDMTAVTVALTAARPNRDKDNGRDNGGWFWKFDWLKNKGVPGKGIDQAPGLQKFFNWNWQGTDNATGRDRNDRGHGRGGGQD